MAVLIDSNVLLRSLHPGHHHYAAAENSVATLRLRGETLCIAPQTLIELWAVATRPREDNGLGLPTARIAAELVSLRRLFRLLPSTPEVLDAWERIVVTHGVAGGGKTNSRRSSGGDYGGAFRAKYPDVQRRPLYAFREYHSARSCPDLKAPAHASARSLPSFAAFRSF